MNAICGGVILVTLRAFVRHSRRLRGIYAREGYRFIERFRFEATKLRSQCIESPDQLFNLRERESTMTLRLSLRGRRCAFKIADLRKYGRKTSPAHSPVTRVGQFLRPARHAGRDFRTLFRILRCVLHTIRALISFVRHESPRCRITRKTRLFLTIVSFLRR